MGHLVLVVISCVVAYWLVGMLACFIVAQRWPSPDYEPDFVLWLLAWPVLAVSTFHGVIFVRLTRYAKRQRTGAVQEFNKREEARMRAVWQHTKKVIAQLQGHLR